MTSNIILKLLIHRTPFSFSRFLCFHAESQGQRAYVGKVNMDTNCPEYYRESTENSVEDTKRYELGHIVYILISVYVMTSFYGTIIIKLLSEKKISVIKNVIERYSSCRVCRMRGLLNVFCNNISADNNYVWILFREQTYDKVLHPRLVKMKWLKGFLFFDGRLLFLLFIHKKVHDFHL